MLCSSDCPRIWYSLLPPHLGCVHATVLSSQKVFVLFLRQGLYVAQVGLKLWTSYISVFTSPVLGYRLIQPHLAYGVLGSQSRTSYRLGQALYSLNYVPSFPEMCVCMRVVCVHVCVTELQSQPQRMGQEIDCYLYTFLNMCGDQRSACLPHLLSSFLLRQSLQLHLELLFGSSCLQEFYLYLSSTRITDWLRYLLGFYVGVLGIWTPGPHSWGANILSTEHHHVPQRHLQSSCPFFLDSI